jgi:hypothetical protein
LTYSKLSHMTNIPQAYNRMQGTPGLPISALLRAEILPCKRHGHSIYPGASIAAGPAMQCSTTGTIPCTCVVTPSGYSWQEKSSPVYVPSAPAISVDASCLDYSLCALIIICKQNELSSAPRAVASESDLSLLQVLPAFPIRPLSYAIDAALTTTSHVSVCLVESRPLQG